MPNIKKLHIALNAGESNRVIYLNKENEIVIGCFVGTKHEAIQNIKEKYKNNKEERDNYIQKVEDCFNGVKYDIDKLVNHEDYRVRAAVAIQGHRLDLLINDNNWRVIQEVARQGHRLDLLINDNNWRVRQEVVCKIKALSIIDICIYNLGSKGSGGMLMRLFNLCKMLIIKWGR